MNKILFSKKIDSPLGPMLAVADEQALYFVEFEGCKGFDRLLDSVQKAAGTTIEPRSNALLDSFEIEVKNYFDKTKRSFETPLKLIGTPFQVEVWEALRKIPYGKTCSYSDLANAVGRPSAFRAVAQANGRNRFAVVIPCHRVVNADGSLGGYGGGISKKKWLLSHEK